MSLNKEALIVHDNFEILGGAERIILLLSKKLKIKIFCFYKNKKIKKNYFNKFFFSNKISIDPRIRFLINFIFYYFYPLNFKKYDKIILSGHYCLMLIRKNLKSKIIYYCHTPPRFMYDNEKQYEKKYYFLFRFPITKFLIEIYKKIYKQKLSCCDIIICNSITTKIRLRKIIKNIKVVVAHPGINFNKFKSKKEKNYYLSLSRLHWSKRVKDKVDVFSNKLLSDTFLFICSFGPERDKILSIIKNKKLKNIKLLGEVSEKKKIKLLSECRGVIHIPIREEFGIVNLEAIASKKLLITTNEGDFGTFSKKYKGSKIISKFTKQKLLNQIIKIEKTQNSYIGFDNKYFKKNFSTQKFLIGVKKVLYDNN